MGPRWAQAVENTTLFKHLPTGAPSQGAVGTPDACNESVSRYCKTLNHFATHLTETTLPLHSARLALLLGDEGLTPRGGAAIDFSGYRTRLA